MFKKQSEEKQKEIDNLKIEII